jgi:hypothetical protein
LEIVPLSVGQIGVERGVFHRPNSGCAENEADSLRVEC